MDGQTLFYRTLPATAGDLKSRGDLTVSMFASATPLHYFFQGQQYFMLRSRKSQQIRLKYFHRKLFSEASPITDF